MQNRILLVIVIILSILLLIVSSSKNTTFFHSEPKIKVLDKESGNLTNLDLEEYIVGVVAAEMPASFNEEALKAQAIAARTYAVYKMQNTNNHYDVVTDVTNQSYITKEKMQEKWGSDYNKYFNKIKDSVDKTKGLVMKYDGDVIIAFYFAMSNGYTEDAKLVFNEEKDYLQSVASTYDNNSLKNFSVTKTLSKNEFCSALEISCDELVISNIARSNTNRVNYITINDKTIKGTSIREKLNLRSTDFDIEEKDGSIFITTRGYGHGVGMSQYGANGMANAGYNYEEILKYYYKNIEIGSI